MLQMKMCSSLEKIFENTEEGLSENSGIYLLRGETGSVQLRIRADSPAHISVCASDSQAVELFETVDVFSGLAAPKDAENCTFVNGGKSGYYPDLLLPLENGLDIKAGEGKTVFARIKTDGLPAAENKLVFTVASGTESAEKTLEVFVSSAKLEEQKLIHTDWFHSDCLSVYYNAPVFSDEYWRITENFIKNAVQYGINCILTPLFTPPLDTEVGGERPTVQLVGVKKDGYTYSFDFTNLKRFTDICRKNGIKYFELSHLFTQWGAKHAPKIIAQTSKGERRIFGWETNSLSRGYISFLKQFAPELKKFTDIEGITDRCFVHCSDEPGMSDIRRYSKCARIIKEDFGCYRHIDALSDFDFFEKGLVETPVPEEGSIERFYNRTERLWTYYCCGQYRNELPNRFFAMPSIRTRILGVLLYKYNCEGFLHWGYNFYFTQLSKRAVDPFKETDAGGAFPSGDAFIVYPGKNGEPYTSLRQQAFFEGLEDMRALAAAEKISSREKTLELIERCLGDISFTSYPMDNKVFLDFRKELFDFIESRI